MPSESLWFAETLRLRVSAAPRSVSKHPRLWFVETLRVAVARPMDHNANFRMAAASPASS